MGNAFAEMDVSVWEHILLHEARHYRAISDLIKQRQKRKGADVLLSEKMANMMQEHDCHALLLEDEAAMLSGHQKNKPFELEPMQLSDWLRCLVEAWQPVMQLHGCELSLRVSDNLMAHTNAALLRSALTNLLSNVMRHHDRAEACEVVVRVADVGDVVEVTLSDNGAGFSAEILADWKKKQVGFDEGMPHGMGLPLTYHMLLVLGGDMCIGNEPDGGAWVVISLPKLPLG